MPGCLHSINIQNFKAFREFHLNLEGRHLLLYGANGSGKSSLYWALYTFLESADKTTDQVHKYFDPENNQSLVNIHASGSGNAFIRLMLNHSDPVESYEISATEHQTQNHSAIAKAKLASDFITYRFFFKFADFRNSQNFDFWELFEREILPFCCTTSGVNLNEEWRSICSNLPHNKGLRGGATKKAYDEFEKRLDDWNSNLLAVIRMIATKAKEFYAKYFGDEVVPIELEIGITDPVRYDRTGKALVSPELQLHVKLAGKVIKRPHVFLNEAKLTQIAISIRFAASLINLYESPVKLLVLDDLLVSLDLSNRMKVVEILLSETFDNYQKIILTHDLGFFREFRRMVGVKHVDWCFKRFFGDAGTGVKQRDEKSEKEKAESYIRNHDLEEAAACLRKAAEDTAVQYRELKEGKRIGSEKFISLSKHLEKAKNVIKSRIPDELFEQVLSNLEPALLTKLVAYMDDDIDGDTDLDDEARVLLKEKRQTLKDFLVRDAWKDFQDIETLDRMLKMTERVLNPASHWGEPALYQAEVQKALTLINRLEECLKPS